MENILKQEKNENKKNVAIVKCKNEVIEQNIKKETENKLEIDFLKEELKEWNINKWSWEDFKW